MRDKRLLVTIVAMVAIGALVAGVFTGVLPRAVRQGLDVTGLVASEAPSTLPSGALDTPAPADPSTASSASPKAAPSRAAPPSANPAALPPDVLAPATPEPGADARDVRARIAAVDGKNVAGRISAEVIDIGTGKALYRKGADVPLTPASTMKLLTSATALRLLGPGHRFTTTVVQPSAGTVTLVGGGDPYLAKKRDPDAYPARASVADLAARTAKELRRQKRKKIKIGYDGSLFSGSSWNPIWPAGYSDQVTATSSLWIDEGRLGGGSPGPRSKDPAGDAATAFAAALRGKGIRITSIVPTQAPEGARVITKASSMTVERIVERVLMLSDNDGAEVLFRQAGLAAQKHGSIAGGRRAVKKALTELGAWHRGAVVRDGSGLARETRVPAETMATLLRLAAQDKHPELRALITGLPVAGVEGSLRHRFASDDTEPARGVVRGKTGTLRKVHSLAGFVRTKDGSMLAYAFLVNDPDNDFAAVQWLEKVTAALAGCGCR